VAGPRGFGVRNQIRFAVGGVPGCGPQRFGITPAFPARSGAAFSDEPAGRPLEGGFNSTISAPWLIRRVPNLTVRIRGLFPFGQDRVSADPNLAVDTPKSEPAQWFAEEVQPHEASLRAVLYRSVRSMPDVDDLVQESFLRIIRARDKGPIRSGKKFLFAVARNAMRDLIRRRAVADLTPITENVAQDVLVERPGVVDLVMRQQELELLAEAVRALPARCREVFLLRKIQGLSQKEIAARLSITENTVETLVAKGARRCADFMQARADHSSLRHGR